jgi:tetratricopeptide (TPR) repeat protein
MEGRFEEARELYKHARRTYDELGNRLARAGLTEVAGPVELAAGDPATAELELRAGLEIFVQSGHRHDYAQALLAEALLAQERFDEARELAAATESATPRGSLANTAWDSVRARIAGRSAPEDGLVLAHKAVEAAQECDSPVLVGDAFFTLAEVLTRAGRPEEALEASQTALAAYERKEDRVSAARLRRLLTEPVR